MGTGETSSDEEEEEGVGAKGSSGGHSEEGSDAGSDSDDDSEVSKGRASPGVCAPAACSYGRAEGWWGLRACPVTPEQA